MDYVELHCKSNFTFLEGASHAEELVEQAAVLGYRGLAMTDRNSLSGVVRGYTVAKEVDIQYIVGAEIVPEDGPPLVMWPTDRAAYGRLCRLITLGRSRREKGECEIYWQDILEYREGLIAGLVLKQPQVDDEFKTPTQPPESGRSSFLPSAPLRPFRGSPMAFMAEYIS